MKDFAYIERFRSLGFGMFVHFGLYSILGKGEWAYKLCEIPEPEYRALSSRFSVRTDWAKELAAKAKSAGCRYITLTTRHHDGFSLYDTCGLSDFDAPHSACGRDLISEFVSACREADLIPFFYHTLIDWSTESKYSDFSEYLTYLRKSVELLCKNYGEIGGIWFDGMWEYPDRDWEEDALYCMIRSYQPQAMIINNTGLNELGKPGHPELDSVTFERGKPLSIDRSGSSKNLASEMCQTLNDHWAYAADDCNYKPTAELIDNLAECRRWGGNFLLNVGPRADGSLGALETGIFERFGVWIEKNGRAIYLPRPSGVQTDSERDFVLEDESAYYAFLHNIFVLGDPNVALSMERRAGCLIRGMKPIASAVWLDSGESVDVQEKEDGIYLPIVPFRYGTSLCIRIARLNRADIACKCSQDRDIV